MKKVNIKAVFLTISSIYLPYIWAFLTPHFRTCETCFYGWLKFYLILPGLAIGVYLRNILETLIKFEHDETSGILISAVITACIISVTYLLVRKKGLVRYISFAVVLALSILYSLFMYGLFRA